MADDLWDSQAPLSNEQFRQLLETPLHKRKASVSHRRQGKGKETVKKARQSVEKEEVKEEDPPLPEELETLQLGFETPSDRPLYRDRARERREGGNADGGGLIGADGSSLYPSAGGMVTDAREMTEEESKFLGGDLEHTHLVKGLDYALLKKERARIQKTEEESTKKEQQRERPKQVKRGVSFASPMGRAVYTALLKQNKMDARVRFRPGQTAFLYNLEDGHELDYRPTILRRPKAECEDGRDHVMANADTNVVNMISTIISYMRASTSGKSEKKVKKKEKQQLLETMLGPPQASDKKQAVLQLECTRDVIEVKPPPPEDDIFDDAGTDYKCEASKKKKRRAVKSKTRVQFENSERHEADQGKAGRDAIEEDDRALLTVDRKTEKDIDPTALPDHYAECYPGFHESYSAAVVDSDEEDLSHMDARGKGVSRYNFETDEEWSKYKQNMEQLPKAAFQYGIKMTDGRKTHSKLVEKHRKEQKLDSQLSKIEKLFKDQGHSHDSAFRSDKKKEAPKEDNVQSSTLPTPKNRKRIRLGED